MRTASMAATAALILAASLGACSRQDATQVKEGAQAAAGKISAAATDIKNDPDVKEAGTAIKESAKEAGTEIKEGAQKAGAEIKEGAQDLSAGAKKVGKEANDEIDGNPKTN